MKFYYLLIWGFMSLLIFKASSQTPKEIKVYDFANKEDLDKYEQLNLDEDHPNLLNPDISKTDMNKVIASWTELHQDIGKYLEENDFEWKTNDEEIMIVHKFYFNPEGKIHSYFFRILNEDISEEKRQQYSKFVKKFAESNTLGLSRDSQFAQCGKTKYLN